MCHYFFKRGCLRFSKSFVMLRNIISKLGWPTSFEEVFNRNKQTVISCISIYQIINTDDNGYYAFSNNYIRIKCIVMYLIPSKLG